MKKIKPLFILLFAGMFILAVSCKSDEQNSCATFDYVEYKGFDSTFVEIDSFNEYQNPILSGFYPDPSICRKGKDYFLVTSTFSYFPGIPIFHSVDLVNWVQTGHVLNRQSQLQINDGVRLSGGIYAPTIRYNPYNETFYVINTLVDVLGNFIVKTKNPFAQNWSDPVPLHINGIDPDIFFDDDGKAYIVHNDEPPGTPELDGHRAIWLREFDVQTDSIVGEKICIVDGGVDKSTKPIWIEAPHLYKINGYYYLMCAEGGTSDWHSEVIFRADKVTGPYIPHKNNPILTQRDLPENRQNPISCAGHADLVETPEGNWYAVFLACRPYEKNYYNTGRETFLLPVQWIDDFPMILPAGKTIPYVVKKPGLQPNPEALKGNFAWRDEFEKDTLHNRWIFIRTPPQKPWWTLKNGKLFIQSTGRTVYEVSHPAFIGARQQHLSFEIKTKLDFKPLSESDIAGLVCYQNQSHNFVFGKSLNESGKACVIVNRSQQTVERLATVEIPDAYSEKSVSLKISGKKDKYSFFVSYDNGDKWIAIAENVDAKNLSTQTAGGFTGAVLGLYTYTNPAQSKEKLKPWDKGAIETKKYRNLFAEVEYSEQKIDLTLQTNYLHNAAKIILLTIILKS